MITKKIISPAGKTWHKIYTLPNSSDYVRYSYSGAVLGSKCFLNFDSDDESDVGTYVIDLNDPNYTPTRILHACFFKILQLPSGRLLFMSSNNTWGGPVAIAYYSDNDGDTWQPANLSSEDGYLGQGVKPILLSNGRLIAIGQVYGQYPKLIYSDNDGETWVFSNIEASKFTVATSGRIFFISSRDNKIYYTDNLETSHLLEVFDDYDQDLMSCKADFIVAVDNNVLFSKSYTSGTEVHRLSFNFTDSQWRDSLVYTNANIKNATLWSIHSRICLYGSGNTYYSDDNGNTWQQKPSDKFLPMNHEYNTYNNRMYAYNSGNIYYSDPETLAEYNSRPLTGKQAKELVQQCKAYVQALKNGN